MAKTRGRRVESKAKQSLSVRRSVPREFIERQPRGWLVVGILDGHWAYELAVVRTGAGVAVREFRIFPMDASVRRRELEAATRDGLTVGMRRKAVEELERFEDQLVANPPESPLPPGGLKASHLRRVSLRSSDGLFALDWRGRIDSAAPASQPAHHNSLGVPPASFRQRRTPEFLSEVSRLYAAAVSEGHWKPNVLVARALRTSPTKIRDAVSKARAVGLLGPAIAQGKRGWRPRGPKKNEGRIGGSANSSTRK